VLGAATAYLPHPPPGMNLFKFVAQHDRAERPAITTRPAQARLDVTWTYGQLADSVSRLAEWLEDAESHASCFLCGAPWLRDCSCGHRRILFCGDSFLHVVAAFACSKVAGTAVIVPQEPTAVETLAKVLLVAQACSAFAVVFDTSAWAKLKPCAATRCAALAPWP
jgi:acyl-CoA synthetase (AMP-forming)/AMP-acid ligase II